MRTVIFLVTLFYCLQGYGKSNCDKIEYKNDELRGYAVWHSPYKATLSVSRFKYRDGRDSLFINFLIKVNGVLNYDMRQNLKGLYIQLPTGTHREPNQMLSSIPLEYTGETGISGRVYLNTDNIDTFMNNKILKIGLSGFEKEISTKSAVELQEFIRCIYGR